MEDEHRSQYRLPAALAEQLKHAADQSGRSLNAEVVARLQASFTRTDEHWLQLIEQGCSRALAAAGKP